MIIESTRTDIINLLEIIREDIKSIVNVSVDKSYWPNYLLYMRKPEIVREVISFIIEKPYIEKE